MKHKKPTPTPPTRWRPSASVQAADARASPTSGPGQAWLAALVQKWGPLGRLPQHGVRPAPRRRDLESSPPVRHAGPQQALQQHRERVKSDGLAHVGCCSGLERPTPIAIGGRSRHDNHDRRQASPTSDADDIEAVPVTQPDIDHDESNAFTGEISQRLSPASSAEHPTAETLQQPLVGREKLRITVHDENGSNRNPPVTFESRGDLPTHWGHSLQPTVSRGDVAPTSLAFSKTRVRNFYASNFHC